MPIYVFRCNHCGHVFEDLMPHDVEEAKVHCLSCKMQGARKLPAVFASSSGTGGGESKDANCGSGKGFR